MISKHLNGRSVWRRTALSALAGMATIAAVGCSSSGSNTEGDKHASNSPEPAPAQDDTNKSLHALIGPAGGELVGKPGTQFAGVHVSIPAGALSEATEISVVPASDGTPLPKTAVPCGPQFAIQPTGLALAQPAIVTLPFDKVAVEDHYRFEDEVKVWALDGDAWGRKEQTDSSEDTVTVEMDMLTIAAAGVNPPAEEDIIHFDLTTANPALLNCFAQYPTDAKRQPKVDAVVVRGPQNDSLFLRGKFIKPELQFDMFTVQNSRLDAAGKPVSPFPGFGLAWYQSDLEADKRGDIRVNIRTILLDQIFGFSDIAGLAPTQTLHLGFWFNNPDDAAACGFDVNKFTPFNGEHHAGPLAMITTPDAETTLGPLCTNPETEPTPHCDP